MNLPDDCAAYPWLTIRNAAGRRELRCERCQRRKRVPLDAETRDAFPRLAIDWITRHRGCVERRVPLN